ncbi:hypothetical protein BGZ80_006757 [Entomortierella chlamydospora]|uniref:Uncharacterized protein n=1 Tax=Entomortierella chlamydospora TaxID=101097 RepID=A0A9P6SSZ8_9FUNG|nr:hypothetical protein BGZ80_006757 [Entomortierella chlamydospora]
MPPPSMPMTTSGPLPPISKGRRPIRALQAQAPLYGMGELKSSLNQDESRGGNFHKNNSLHDDDICPDLSYSGIDSYHFELNQNRPVL